MEARKDNKVYQVTEQEGESYRAQGYDLYKNGKLFKHAIGKTVPIDKYEEAVAKIEALEAQLAEPEKKRRGR